MMLFTPRGRDVPFWLWALVKENRKGLLIFACWIVALIAIRHAFN